MKYTVTFNEPPVNGYSVYTISDKDGPIANIYGDMADIASMAVIRYLESGAKITPRDLFDRVYEKDDEVRKGE